MALIGTRCTACESINNWKFKVTPHNPQSYAKKLMNSDRFGCVDFCNEKAVGWWVQKEMENPLLLFVQIRDELIPHETQGLNDVHYDFVYSTGYFDGINHIHAKLLAMVSGSISVDLLKNEVTVRGDSVLRNQVVLGLVYDLVNQRIDYNPENLKNEYLSRFIHNTVISEYPDILSERSKMDVRYDIIHRS